MSSSLRLELSTPLSDDRPVFVSGNFCDWLPDLPQFQMQAVGQNQFVYEFPKGMALPKTLEYKYTRGGWEHVELDSSGESVANRTVSRAVSSKREYVPHWRWFGMPFNPAFLPKIELLGDTFKVPRLIQTRQVHVLLPHDYEQSDKRYPVLYLHDGQNLFGGVLVMEAGRLTRKWPFWLPDIIMRSSSSPLIMPTMSVSGSLRLSVLVQVRAEGSTTWILFGIP
ncbi:hypothetical protein [Spirosoma telluris]|uniref:hypothetical protein n=1 Tax=Spirosoma telluris TaxID=2183553 RepID=UPI002FC2A8C9